MTSKEKLDRVFSEFIRLRDSDSNGLIRCISCGKRVFWKESDCGHYVNRKHMSLRYDEKNCNAQCRACNRFDEGNMIGYNHGLVEKYGDSVILYLESKKKNTTKFNECVYSELIKHYRGEIKILKKEKGI